MTVESLPTSEIEQEADAANCSSCAGDRTLAVISGIGLLTPLGRTVGETWQSLLDGRFIADHAKAAGEFDRGSPRVIQMARAAADQAVAEAGWADDDFATIVGTSKGSVESWLRSATPLQHISDSRYQAGGQDGQFRLPDTRPDIAGLGDVAAALAGQGPKLTVSAACASGLLALGRAVMMIRAGEARRVLVVAAEASVHPLFLGSFKRLGVLPRAEIGCRPFDELRDGFLMSEAAAAVCVEARELNASGSSLTRTGPASGVVVDRFAQGADATHLTAGDPDGRVLRYLIRKVLPPQGVDLVHAHGTGTVANDPVELAAIESALADTPQPTSSPCLYSHKGALGHSLGAAGLISVVLNVLAHRAGTMPPNVRTTRPLATRRVSISPNVQRRPIRRSIALAAGFGGAVAAVSLQTL